MSNTISRTHYDRLDQRRLWLTNRIEAKEKTGWDTAYDISERDALAAALAVLSPVKDSGHPPIPEGWERVQDGMLKKGDKYCLPRFSAWIDACMDSSDHMYRAVVIRKAKDATPDPGDGYRRAEGEDWKDERCERFYNGNWIPRSAPGEPFSLHFHYRIPIDPAPKHPPVPDGWQLIDPKKDGPKRADDMLWLATGRCWSDVCDDGSFDEGITYIRRIEPQYRPFASAEEFDPHAGRVVVNIGTGTRRRIDLWSDKGCMGMSWDMVHRKFRFLDDGSPFGVEVKP